MRVLTIGHSTREPEAFVRLLKEAGVTLLVDVRTVPRSLRVPWSSIDALPGALAPHGIGYVHVPELGGLRKPRPDSPNAAWENAGFRGYADHMRTAEFRRGLDRLLDLASRETPCVMCAEAVPWRCHRNLLSDALVARGVEVEHILDAGRKPHALTPFARVVGGLPTYPPKGGRQTRL